MLLANAIGSALLLVGLIAGAAGLTAAIVIETSLLRLLWGRRRVWRWVLGANVASFAVGVIPTILLTVIQAPGPDVDPWEWYQTSWRNLLAYAVALLLLTLIVEGGVYCWLNRCLAAQLPMRRLLWATALANVISYVPLTGYVLHTARDVGDFVLLPDSRWVKADETRVYFVDQRTNQINSIRLDGTDRRLELSAILGRFEGEVDEGCYFALLRDDPRILYVAPDRRWHLSAAEGDRTLDTGLPGFHGWAYRGDAAISLQQALAEIGIERPVPNGDQPMDGVYLSSTTQFDFDAWGQEMGPYEVGSGSSPYLGAGPGLVLRRSSQSSALRFGIWAFGQNLACNNPAVLPDNETVVFRCGNAIMVLDLKTRRVGRLARGDSLLLKLPQFSNGEWDLHAPQPTPTTAPNERGGGVGVRAGEPDQGA